ncbi:acyl-CoA carboxylase subunit epsilon [Microbispora sp. ATCC PTA-5024]|uniref:acyl-CoA carboxylase subunit epsilon n=1 Tax=Microbispora sp. ATCC PTA-5024 TaxID=316330 RepID=UPI0003DD23E2|nr:acyl-CoA carboxylase subunit epsilon [Microbispora sp. ATCC PTA-5024]ETK33417.1 acyl-CoA dehydrogenase [Microbispora sp. ATCC PTA-5024]
MSEREPYLTIVRGDATPEETAALVAAIAARAAAGRPQPAPTAAAGRWRDPAREMRRPLAHGPGAWRTAFLGR